MPVTSLLASIGAIAAFGLYMAVLGWAVWYTREITPNFDSVQRPKAADQADGARPKPPDLRDAA